MKYLFIYLFTIFSFGQNTNNDYEEILNGLNLSYVKFSDESVIKEYLKLYNKTNKDYLTDQSKYQISVENFFNSEIEIIKYLLNFENNFDYCKWIETKKPGSSKTSSTITKNNSALVLIDNFLTPEKKEISIRKNNINFKKIKRFLIKNKNLNLESLRQKYWKKFGGCGGNESKW